MTVQSKGEGWEIIQGDCLEVLRGLVEAGSVDAVVTDPPYGIGLGKTKGAGNGHGLKLTAYDSYQDTHENFAREIIPRLNASLNLAKRAAVFTGPHIHEQRKPAALGGIYCSAGAGRHCWGFKTFLPILFYGKAPDLHKGARSIVLASNARAEKNGHPCPKPLEWMRWLIELTTRPGELVLDPFMGSGTTGVACLQTGRRFLGVELSPEYFAIAEKRLREVAPRLPLGA